MYILLATQNILFICDSLATLLNGIAADRTHFTCIFMSYLVIILKGEEAVCVCVCVHVHAHMRERERQSEMSEYEIYGYVINTICDFRLLPWLNYRAKIRAIFLVMCGIFSHNVTLFILYLVTEPLMMFSSTLGSSEHCMGNSAV